MSDIELDSYFQVGNSEPTDAYQPGSGKQRIDLDEYYEETQQGESTIMVQGYEAFTFGKITKRLAQQLNIQGCENYDPFASERNARAGNEGFLSNLAEKFENLIMGIIKYVRMVIDWIVDTIGGFLGFRKKSSITAESSEKEKDLTKEFEKTLIALGFPVAEYSLEKYLQDLPANEAGPFQLLFMKSKLVDDKEAIEGVADALPLIQQSIVKLKTASDKATNSQKYLKRVIEEEYKRVRARKATGKINDLIESTEFNRVLKAIMDVKSNLDAKSIAVTVNKLYTALYKTKFTDEQLETGYNNIRAELKKTLITQKVTITGNGAQKALHNIQVLNKRYLEISDKELDLSSIDWRSIGKIVDKTDAEKIKAIDDFYPGGGLVATYHAMGVDVRNFVQFCLSVTNSMLVVEKQASNLVSWHTKARLFFYNGVVGDVEKMMEVAKSVEAMDDEQELKRQIKKLGRLRFVKDPEAETLQRVLSRVGAGEKVHSELKSFETQINNFARQTGLGVK